MKKTTLVFTLCLLCTMLAMVAIPAQATTDYSNYPNIPVTAVVAWAPGGGNDLLTRAMTSQFHDLTGQALIVSNLEGGASVAGVTEYMGYNDNGYNILSWATSQTIKTQMQVTPYSIDDFKTVCGFTLDSPYILVRADSPFQTLNDLVDYAKANPGKLTVGNAGTGGGNHLAALQFCIAADIEVNHIAFEGGAASSQSVLAGEIDCSMNGAPEGTVLIESGDLRVLTVLSAERSPFYPDIPTAMECGYDVLNRQARGFVVHKSTPDEVVAKLEEIFRQVAETDSFKENIMALTYNVQFSDAAGYAEMLTAENELYRDIIQQNSLGDRY